jgi:hypothetical protein
VKNVHLRRVVVGRRTRLVGAARPQTQHHQRAGHERGPGGRGPVAGHGGRRRERRRRGIALGGDRACRTRTRLHEVIRETEARRRATTPRDS